MATVAKISVPGQEVEKYSSKRGHKLAFRQPWILAVDILDLRLKFWLLRDSGIVVKVLVSLSYSTEYFQEKSPCGMKSEDTGDMEQVH